MLADSGVSMAVAGSIAGTTPGTLSNHYDEPNQKRQLTPWAAQGPNNQVARTPVQRAKVAE